MDYSELVKDLKKISAKHQVHVFLEHSKSGTCDEVVIFKDPYDIYENKKRLYFSNAYIKPIGNNKAQIIKSKYNKPDKIKTFEE